MSARDAVPSILRRIVEHKRLEVATRKAANPQPEGAGAVRDFAAALLRPQVALIAEIKQASPSRGILRDGFDAPSMARRYHAGGAACLSVLTDEAFFRGSDADLIGARAAVPLPVLRKDFVIDAWQVGESRAIGADAILLIVAILTPAEILEFQAEAHALGMAALVETHAEAELCLALELGCPLIGINNRDLHSFTTDLSVSERLGSLIPRDRTWVSESGIFTGEDVARVAAAGARAVLVGEALMRDGDPVERVAELAAVPARC